MIRGLRGESKPSERLMTRPTTIYFVVAGLAKFDGEFSMLYEAG
jgi:hypothetical protein